MNQRVSGDHARYSEFSERLKTVLKLENSPVGVKLIKVGEKLPSIAEPENPIVVLRIHSTGKEGRNNSPGKG